MTTLFVRSLCGLAFISTALSSDTSAACRQASHGNAAKVCLDEHSSLLQIVSTVQQRSVETPHRQVNAGALLAANATTNATSAVTEALPAPIQVVYTPDPPPSQALVDVGMVVFVFTAVALTVFMVLACGGWLKTWIGKPKGMTREEVQVYSSSKGIYVTLISWTFVMMVTTDQYLPSLSKIEVDFNTTPQIMSSTLQVNWALKAMSALVMAHLAENYGRIRMLQLTALMSAAGSFCCGCAPSVGWFLGARCFQGIAEGGEPILMMIGRDMFETPEERVSFMGGVMVALVLVPALAPAFGGILGHYIGWRAPFFIMATWSFLNVPLMHWLGKETNPIDAPESKSIEDYKQEIKRVLGNMHFMTLAWVTSAGMMIVYAFDTNFSLIMGDVFGQNQLEIAWKTGCFCLSAIPAALLCGNLADHIGTVNILRVGILFALVPTIMGFVIGDFFSSTWQPLFVFAMITMFTCFTHAMGGESLYFQPVKDMSGAASGMMTFMTMVATSVGSVLSSSIVQPASDKVQALTCFVSATFVVSFVVFWVGFGWNPPRWAYEDSEKAHAEKSLEGDKMSPESMQGAQMQSSCFKTFESCKPSMKCSRGDKQETETPKWWLPRCLVPMKQMSCVPCPASQS